MGIVQKLEEVFLAFNETDQINRTRALAELVIRIFSRVPASMSPFTLAQNSVSFSHQGLGVVRYLAKADKADKHPIPSHHPAQQNQNFSQFLL